MESKLDEIMQQIVSFVSGKKTYIVSGLLVLVSLVSLIAGEITLVDFLKGPDMLILLNGLGLASLRAGISKLQ